MTPNDAKKQRAELAKLLVGATVVAIGPPDEGQEELFKMTVKRGVFVTEVHFHATDLGWWFT